MNGVVTSELDPRMKDILTDLATKGRPGRAVAAGLDFVFYNWAGLIDENVESDPEETVSNLWGIMEGYVATLFQARKDVLGGLEAAAVSSPAAMPASIQSMLSEMEEQEIHMIAAADTVRELYSGWIVALSAGASAGELAKDFDEAAKMVESVSAPAKIALESATEAGASTGLSAS